MQVLEPPREVDIIANRVVGAALEVHRKLGPGFLESVYEGALLLELDLLGLRVERQKSLGILYKGHVSESTGWTCSSKET